MEAGQVSFIEYCMQRISMIC